MGVKELWSILSRVPKECPLSELRGKVLAVDLSCWICQAHTAKGLRDAVSKPHLRNLFFRVHRLYSEGVTLVIVVDGKATPLKWTAMDQREGRASTRGGCGRKTGRRTQLDNKMKECCQLLEVMGVPYLQSEGEAEAMCAHLNMTGLVDGVITEDSDAFLYGARTLYRDLSTNEKSSKVSVYSMDTIRDQLGITRRDLIGLALLLGCDYCPGVMGVGKEGAMKLLQLCKTGHFDKGSFDLLELFQVWVKGGLMAEENVLEKRIKKKALAVSGFPSVEVVDEFLRDVGVLPDIECLKNWKMPQLNAIQRFCFDHLQWPLVYTYQKCQSFLTQWVLHHAILCHSEGCSTHCIKPIQITRTRVRHGLRCYEVEWEGVGSLSPLTDEVTLPSADPPSDAADSKMKFTTIELADRFVQGFPSMCCDYEQERAVKAINKSKGKKASTLCHGSRDNSTDDVLSNALCKISLGSDSTTTGHEVGTECESRVAVTGSRCTMRTRLSNSSVESTCLKFDGVNSQKPVPDLKVFPDPEKDVAGFVSTDDDDDEPAALFERIKAKQHISDTHSLKSATTMPCTVSSALGLGVDMCTCEQLGVHLKYAKGLSSSSGKAELQSKLPSKQPFTDKPQTSSIADVPQVSKRESANELLSLIGHSASTAIVLD